MKDLMKFVAMCQAELDGIGIKYGRVCSWTVNTCAKGRLGQCVKVALGEFDINISTRRRGISQYDDVRIETIFYEMLLQY